jgi:hypothetical protein
MDALDRTGPDGELPLAMDRTNAVKISRNGTAVTGSLLRIKGGENGKPIDANTLEEGIDQ